MHGCVVQSVSVKDHEERLPTLGLQTHDCCHRNMTDFAKLLEVSMSDKDVRGRCSPF